MMVDVVGGSSDVRMYPKYQREVDGICAYSIIVDACSTAGYVEYTTE